MKSLDAQTTNGPGSEYQANLSQPPIIFLSGVFGGASVRLEAYYTSLQTWFPVEYTTWTQPGVFRWAGNIDSRLAVLSLPGKPSKYRLTITGASGTTNINGWIE